MNETGLEKTSSTSLKERGQYAMAFGVIALMLWVANFPVFMLAFVGALTFFVWKVFSSESRHETRRIFEFYLNANEILREDDRRWYGFEIQEAISRGESIVKAMTAPPPLVNFALGALYQKIGDHSSAVKQLAIVADETPGEAAIVFPTNELREYVRMLRKIERAPAEAPLTTSAIRSLERARKNRAKDLLEKSRAEIAKPAPELPAAEKQPVSVTEISSSGEENTAHAIIPSSFQEKSNMPLLHREASNRKRPTRRPDPNNGSRKTISEVLHDIYDGNVQ